MSTEAEVVDSERLEQVLSDLRSDSAGVERKSWVLLGHVDNNPNMVEVVGEDTGPEASLEDFRNLLADDQVQYGLLRMTSAVDMSCTVKFVYVHWIGENIPFAKRGRFGVVHGSVVQHFNPFHLLVEPGNLEDLEEEALIQRLDESSGTKNHIIEGSVEGRQERGFLQHGRRSAGGGGYRPVASEGEVVETTPELQEAIGEVRDDKSPITWVLAGYEGGNIKSGLTVVEKGSGGMDDIKEQLIDDQVMYALYRITDMIDDIETVKFVYIYWIGPDTKPITKGKVSAYTGPVERIFTPAHVSISFNNRYDIEEDIIKDKVMASSGSKSFVM